MMRRVVFCCLLVIGLISEVRSQSLALPAVPQAAFEQHLGAALPLQAAFMDDDGRPVLLGGFFSNKPVVLVLGYYHCTNLCSTLFEGVLQGLGMSGVEPDAYRLIAVSIDPRESATLAADKKRAYRNLVNGDGHNVHLLTGEETSIAVLTNATGFQYSFDRASGQYAHPAGFLVATPDGRIAQYFMGVRFEPADLRRALTEASGSHVGTLAQQLLLLCSHYNPATGRYSGLAMTAIRTACLLVLASLLAWVWRQRLRKGAADE